MRHTTIPERHAGRRCDRPPGRAFPAPAFVPPPERIMRVDCELDSLWPAVEDPDDWPGKLPRRAEVCVVGAGMAGLCVAYQLSRAGKRVLVVDDGPACGGNTGRTTAHLSCVIDDRFTEVERIRGVEASKLAAQAHAAAIDWIEQAAIREGIRCEFQRVDGYLFEPPERRSDFLTK